jgi:hypothetical protein
VVKTDAAGRVASTASTAAARPLLRDDAPGRGDDFVGWCQPILLDGDSGLRLMLSGDKRAVGAAVDDQTTSIRSRWVADPGRRGPGAPAWSSPARVELVDAVTGKVVLTTRPCHRGPTPSRSPPPGHRRR